MRILLMLVVLPVLLLFCILIAYRVPLPASLSGARDLVAAVAAGLAGAGYLLALVVTLLVSLRRSARTLDLVLEPLGLVGQKYAAFGRCYAGVLEGQPVEVRYLSAQAMRAARLDLVVEAGLGTRIALGRQRPLLDCRDCPQLDLDIDLPYRVYAQDSEAVRDLLADPAVQAILDRLMDAERSAELYVQPDRLWFRVRPWRVEGTEIERWLRDLARLPGIRP